MIDDRTIAHVARLARLELSRDEIEAFRAQLGSILDHFKTLQALDLADVPATSHVLPMTNVLREDVPERSLPREEVLAAAPAAEDGYFVVPPVIETE
ncbi:MAG TPA: Asp-tRNA(Asn)/Glu-tRNA(Gln) amidotransferase subunit GatC [bacterium]|nr:Asp-tRNA(Asn)/Glu-tRNA(Gln) amidotransferase subunit GatC [bacterium]